MLLSLLLPSSLGMVKIFEESKVDGDELFICTATTFHFLDLKKGVKLPLFEWEESLGQFFKVTLFSFFSFLSYFSFLSSSSYPSFSFPFSSFPNPLLFLLFLFFSFSFVSS